MTLLDLAVQRRAAEQLSGIAFDRKHERDSWRLTGPAAPKAKRTRRPCLAGDCSDRVVAMGYCHRHAQKIRGGVALDRDVVFRRAP
jgi:hypothetical protein